MYGLYSSSESELLKILSDNKNIEEVIIYGSRAKGNFREGSDIDLAVKGTISADEIFSIKNTIEESSIPYLVDLIVYDEIMSEELLEHINRAGKIFYTR